MATLQEALEGARSGGTFVYQYEDGGRTFISPSIYGPDKVRHDHISGHEMGMGGRADLRVEDILNNHNWPQDNWQPTINMDQLRLSAAYDTEEEQEE